MAEAINFKKINSRKYKAWRILSAPNGWGEVYRLREIKFGQVSGAIIFPEQILGLNSSIYSVAGSRSGGSASTHIKLWSPKLTAPAGVMDARTSDELETCEEVYECERHWQPRDKVGLCIRITDIQDMTFASLDLALFTNIKDALKYQATLMASMVSQIG